MIDGYRIPVLEHNSLATLIVLDCSKSANFVEDCPDYSYFLGNARLLCSLWEKMSENMAKNEESIRFIVEYIGTILAELFNT